MAEAQAKESEKYFDELCKSVGPEKTKAWTELEEHMQLTRDNDIKVMDQLDVRERKGSQSTPPFHSDIEPQLWDRIYEIRYDDPVGSQRS